METLNSREFLSQFMDAVLAENAKKEIWEGAEPHIIVYREEIGIEIPIKGVVMRNGLVVVRV